MVTKYVEYIKEFNKFDKPWIDGIKTASTKELYYFVNSIANKIGDEVVEKMKPLGTGSFGTAFQLKSGKVLKFTKDVMEAAMCNWLIDKDTKYLISIYDVIQLKGTMNSNDLFVIVMDKVKTHKKEIKFGGEISLIWEAVSDALFHDYTFTTLDDFLETYNKKDTAYDRRYISTNKQVKYITENFESIKGIVEELRKFHIENPDLHAGNVGWKEDGQMVHFDIRDYNATPQFLEQKYNSINVENILGDIKNSQERRLTKNIFKKVLFYIEDKLDKKNKIR
jgi:hypothetical protein